MKSKKKNSIPSNHPLNTVAQMLFWVDHDGVPAEAWAALTAAAMTRPDCWPALLRIQETLCAQAMRLPD